MYDTLQRIVTASGLWKEPAHRFRLSPQVYEISETQREELDALGRALHECLAGVGRIAAIALHPDLGQSRAWRTVAATLGAQVPSLYREAMLLRPGAVPAIYKVDLLVGEGGWHLIEIDGQNIENHGYAVLTQKLCAALRPEADTLPGVAVAIAECMRKRGQQRLALIYAEPENPSHANFYLPAFRILQAELAGEGIELLVAGERSVSAGEGKPVIEEREVRLFMDLPFFRHNHCLGRRLAELYQAEEIEFLVPPKPFLGSKALLALLRNEEGDEALEVVLRSQIPPESLATVRRYIPATYFTSKKAEGRSRFGDQPFVLKRYLAGSMRGVWFSDDPEGERALRASNSSGFICQREIRNTSHRFATFGDSGDVTEQDGWNVRLIVHYAARRAVDMTVTATQGKHVHGGRDAIMLGTTIN